MENDGNLSSQQEFETESLNTAYKAALAAAEARQASAERSHNIAKNLTIKHIMRAAREGKNMINLSARIDGIKIDDLVIKYLRELGYSVKHQYDQRDGDFVTIKW